MKNLDPKIVIPACIVILVLAAFIILRTAGVGKDNTPPPIATGGPPVAAGAAGTAGAPGAPAMTLPGTAEAQSRNPPMPQMGGVPGTAGR